MRSFAQNAGWFLPALALLVSRQAMDGSTFEDGGKPAAPATSLARMAQWTQVVTKVLAPGDPTLPATVRGKPDARVQEDVPGRKPPPLTRVAELTLPNLRARTIPLPIANTMAHANYATRRFGKVETRDGHVLLFNPECILVQFRDQETVAALAVESGQELEAVRTLLRRADVDFAELDFLQHQDFTPNDPLLASQWHHKTLGSFAAWDKSLGQGFVRVAIVDAPFQMNHPDLAANTLAGWDVVANVPVTGSSGIHHSTFTAGMVAGVVDNALGVAGAVNCKILPLNINGFTSEMCNAVYWAATNGVRVVNISWSGADSAALNAAGAYLRTVGHGVVVMSGVNGSGFLDYPNQPDIWCVSMTDAADNPQSSYGYHVDFSAPGWAVYSTTTNNGYALDSGTSYATPSVSGLLALLFSINPALGPEEAISLLKSTASDKGPSGWDMWHGWGRINSAAAASAASAALPKLSAVLQTDGQIRLTFPFRPGLVYQLHSTKDLSNPSWEQVSDAVISNDSGQLLVTVPRASRDIEFFRLEISTP